MKTKTKYFSFLFIFFTTIIYVQDTTSINIVNEEGSQSRASQAMDATATQWSFQVAYQSMPDYHNDLVNGEERRKGLDNYAQLRVVAPVPLKSMTLLPRLTIRHYEDLEKKASEKGLAIESLIKDPVKR